MDGPPPPSGSVPPPPPAPPAPGPTHTRRRWPVVVLAILALLGLVAAGVAVQQRQVAALWQDRAERYELARDEAVTRGDALERQLDEVVGHLATSEADVGELEERLRELADEKAQAEDVATTTGVERDSLVALSGSIAGAVGSLDSCVNELFDLLNDAIDAFNRQGAGEEVEVGPLNAARTATTARCNAARSEAATAAARAEQLLR